MGEPLNGGEKRAAERVPIELRVEYKRLNTFFSDYTKNISQGGTFIKTKKPLDVGTSFRFLLHVPTLPEPLEIFGSVQWIRETGDDPGMGIEFAFDDGEAHQRLQATVEKLMADSLGEKISKSLLNQKK
jgi:type IV pilus assembly protein PilZ